MPSWAQALGDRQHEARQELAGALRAYHNQAIAPYWEQLQLSIDADRAVRTRILLDSGINGLLDSLRPAVRWNPPVLEVDCAGPDRDEQLDGRGLQLVPSWFCRPRPCSLADSTLPQVLVYPIDSGLSGNPASRQLALADLLGRTRATVLLTISQAATLTTTELARRTAISLASASQHASILRNAGLIATQRHANSVFHTITPLGATLLQPPDSSPPMTSASK
jgi:DNA-binding transcriptional ArsR family regulator